MSKKVSFQNSNISDITLSAILYFPENFDESHHYPAVIVTHPGGGVKEQTSGLYASKFAENGFIAIAFDASYQGESTGMPRQLENPYIRVEDISAVLDYLITLPYIDEERIAAFGICAGGFYTVNAAINDKRIKVLGTASAVDFGALFKNGWDGTGKIEDSFPHLMLGADARSKEAKGIKADMIPLAPLTKEDAPTEEWQEAWEYYRTDRAQHPTAPSLMTARSLTQLVTFTPATLAESFLTQPVILSVGDHAGSAWMSEKLTKTAKNAKEAKFVTIEDANHFTLYDGEKAVPKVVKETTSFFKKHLNIN